jgi:hypothetical protein
MGSPAQRFAAGEATTREWKFGDLNGHREDNQILIAGDTHLLWKYPKWIRASDGQWAQTVLNPASAQRSHKPCSDLTGSNPHRNIYGAMCGFFLS